MAKVGYARVSTDDQSLALQLDALKAAGCRRIEREKVSGASKRRPVLDALLPTLKRGDVLTVWRLDRLGRSLPHLVQVIAQLEERGIGFVSVTEAIDTKSAGGRLVFHLFAALAEFERSLIAERTKAGLRSAKRRGVKLGRRYGLTLDQVEKARKLIAAGDGPADVAAAFGVSRSTLYRNLARGA